MGKQKLDFDDFIVTVSSQCKEFVSELHDILTKQGCIFEVKEAKSGYVGSYLKDKKTIANYVFRKKGLFIRIYANHINNYMTFLDTLPDEMIQNISAAPPCKRLINPDTCNSKCAMGYEFFLKGEHFQKCRNNAFMFLVREENNSYIREFMEKEVKAYN